MEKAGKEAPGGGYAVVAGGVNLDIGGRPAAALVLGDSNPGRVRMSLGGVGRNIAHNMALLGCDVRLLTVLGDDAPARQIDASCRELGIDVSQALRVPGAATSVYLFIAGNDGDMAAAVSDMELYERLTPAFLESRRELLAGARLVVVDANIPAASIRWLCENVKAPLFADPVSTAKAAKLKPVLGKLHTLKPNRIEAELLSGVPITDEESLARSARELLETGLRRVFVSLGSAGVYAADHSGAVRLACLPAQAVNATGAGDAFMAALAWAELKGADLADAARLAQAAAAIAVEGAQTINPALSQERVRMRSGLIRGGGKGEKSHV